MEKNREIDKRPLSLAWSWRSDFVINIYSQGWFNQFIKFLYRFVRLLRLKSHRVRLLREIRFERIGLGSFENKNPRPILPDDDRHLDGLFDLCFVFVKKNYKH